MRLKECSYDLLLFTEVWIGDDMQECEYSIPGFQTPIVDPNMRGGACIYVREGLEYYAVQPPIKMQESVWIVIKTREHINRIYACIYRSPNSIDENNDNLISNIEWAKANYSECILVGDFNLPKINWENELASNDYCKKFLECLQDNGYEQIISEPTRFRNNQVPSILDLIIVSNPDIISGVQIDVPFGKSDHCTIEFTVKNCENKRKIIKDRFNFKKIDKEKFVEIVSSYDWDDICDEDAEIDIAYELFINIITDAIASSTPSHKNKNRNKTPWSTKLVEKLASKKRQLWHKYKASKSQEDYDRYKHVLNDFNNEKDIAILNYENKIIAGKDANPKQFYSYVSLKNKYGNSKIVLSNDGIVETDEYKCANTMNTFFGSVFTTGESQIPEFERDRNIVAMPEMTITASSIKTKLEQLDTHKASGPDHLPCVILKTFANLFSPILLKFFSRSYEESRVPILMKSAFVVPLHKSGDRTSTNNYRPVSLTPIIAKVFESLFYDEMVAHIERNGILAEEQHGFRKNRSTNTNLLQFWNDITALANTGKEVSVIYTDLRKAFDSVPHDLLIYKLERYGIRGKNLKWVKDFLRDRQQRVKISDVYSEPISVKSGVPQGGVISGLMFILYMNDLPKCLKYVKTSMYADDAKLFAPITHKYDEACVQQDLDELARWCLKWRMRLNADKCFLLHYVPQNIQKNYPSYFIEGRELNRKENASDLGVMIEGNLKFHEQVAKACKKATSQTNTIRRTFKSRNPKFLESMYKTFVRPHLEYCVQVWNPGYIGDIAKMEQVQNRFTRLLPQSRIMTQSERNKRLNITSHETRRLRGDLIYMYKMFDSGLFTPSPETRTRGHSRKLVLERAQNNLRKHSFATRNVTAWNNLPDHVVSAQSLNIFKSRLDAYLSPSMNLVI